MRGFLAVLLAGLALVGCTEPVRLESASPPTRPVQPRSATGLTEPSAASLELAAYYRKLEADQLTRGLMRTDGGGPDTPFGADDLERNFETLVFSDEYQRRYDTAGRLNRWAMPVRISTEFGPSVASDRRERDRATVSGYANRLSRLTGHPITLAQTGANFHVFVAGEDDKGFVEDRVRQLLPSLGPADLSLLRNLPRQYFCLVLTVPDQGTHTYSGAVVLIRDEHSGLMRQSCFHEEIAQGLGIPNDSPRARPSIFNDDDEFALLTAQDEMLLTMLYNPRLKPGMTISEARPILHQIAQELLGPAS